MYEVEDAPIDVCSDNSRHHGGQLEGCGTAMKNERTNCSKCRYAIAIFAHFQCDHVVKINITAYRATSFITMPEWRDDEGHLLACKYFSYIVQQHLPLQVNFKKK